MATSNPAFELDTTGSSKKNYREREVYTLPETQSMIRAVSPVMGCFFTNSVMVVDKATGKAIKFGRDYIFTEIYSSLSTIYKQQVAATIVIISQSVSNEIEVSYNFLGAQFTQSLPGIAETINLEADKGRPSKLQWNIINQLKPFIPPDYSKIVGEGIGFETVVCALESLRSIILYDGYNLDSSVAQYIDEFIAALYNILDNLTEFSYKDKMINFMKQFTKEKLGLDKVKNMGLVGPEAAKQVAIREHQFDPSFDGYITLKAISAFKTELYSNLVNSEHTGIGKHYGVYGLPLLETLFSMRNGASIIINSLETSTVSGYDFNKNVYPDSTSPSCQWSIVKMTNNATGNGGVLWGTNMLTGELYVGQLLNEINHPEVLTWVKLYGEYDLEKALKALTDHSSRVDNPHAVNKHQLGLGFVENLPLAGYEDLACRVPSEKYVSHKFLLAFMSTYMSGLKTSADLKDMNCDDNEVIRNIKLIFAPCGPCGPCCEPNIVEVTAAPTTSIPIVDPEGQLTSWYCDLNKRWDVITDGFGGTKTIEHIYGLNDPDKVADGCVVILTTTTTTTTTTSVPPVTTTTTTIEPQPAYFVTGYREGTEGYTFKEILKPNENYVSFFYNDFAENYEDNWISRGSHIWSSSSASNESRSFAELKLHGITKDKIDQVSIDFYPFEYNTFEDGVGFSDTPDFKNRLTVIPVSEVSTRHFGYEIVENEANIEDQSIYISLFIGNGYLLEADSNDDKKTVVLVIKINNIEEYAIPVSLHKGTLLLEGINLATYSDIIVGNWDFLEILKLPKSVWTAGSNIQN